ncbi:hypothetical protein M758_4G160000 [Ceratodon purpureus]|uniref:Knr4/Smi1-like domain-containing protein n=1 Tax=Ceratodon purpureus TaxID=3225 RepID=A0A8T0ICM3_CERPU|nr:hypothetical protein KC19_4G159300 [Ceratodon purpureus]KAG0619725.1 hypothetical protein M758_4G160000 [Ceratodon purpureus]
MLDVEQRPGEALRGNLTQHQAQVAGLKRLSARASAGPSTPPGTRRVFFSFSAYARSVIDHLKRCDVPIAEGLSDEEFEKIEATYGFTFPPDLKGILQEGLPMGSGFPNWRSSNVQHLKMRLNLPVLGLLHEVANSKFWWKTWGPRPVDIDVAIRIARTALRKFPLLIPMYGHCYIASSPNLAGNPVFFVYQKDVVYCGYDVADFFERDAFRAHDYDPALEADDWQDNSGSGPSGRSSISGNGDNKRGDIFHTDVDSTYRSSSSSSATDQSDVSGTGSSESQSETWGRNLDALAKNAESLSTPRSRGNIFSRFGRSRSKNVHRQPLKSSSVDDNASVEAESPRSSICQDDIVRYGQIIEKPLPSRTLMNLSMAVPPWAARSPRRIEFWSDLAEKHQKQHSCAHAHGESVPLDEVVAAPLSPVKENPAKEALERKDQSAAKSSMWLTGYLEEMSLVLRQGGWEEDDISDMMDSKTPPDLWDQQIDAEAVLVTLAKEVELLSTSLKKAGWSVPDVTETMKMGLSTVW